MHLCLFIYVKSCFVDLLKQDLGQWLFWGNSRQEFDLLFRLLSFIDNKTYSSPQYLLWHLLTGLHSDYIDYTVVIVK